MKRKQTRRGLPGLQEGRENKLRKRIIAATTVLLLLVLLPGAVWLLSKGLVPEEREFHIPLPGADQNSEAFLLSIGQKMIMSFVQRDQGEFIILHPESDHPTLVLRLFKRGTWAKRNAHTQKAVCSYIQSVIPQARVLVGNYLPQGADTPNYEAIYKNVQAKLCSSCWAVVEGKGNSPTYLVAGNQVLRRLPNSGSIRSIKDL